MKTVQQLLNHQPPTINPLHWKDRWQQLTGLDVDACPFCGLKTLKQIGFIPRLFVPIGRSPPVQVQIITPQGELIPFAA